MSLLSVLDLLVKLVHICFFEYYSDFFSINLIIYETSISIQIIFIVKVITFLNEIIYNLLLTPVER